MKEFAVALPVMRLFIHCVSIEIGFERWSCGFFWREKTWRAQGKALERL